MVREIGKPGGVRGSNRVAAVEVRAREHAAWTLRQKDCHMTIEQKDGVSIADTSSMAPRRKPHSGGWFWLMGWLFSRNAAAETVATSVRFHASPETVWERMLMYEEVPARPPLLLRLFVPHPVRTEGDKTCVGAALQCTYNHGHLVKRIKVVELPRLVEFEVIEQRLGIEGRITMLGGSYEIRSCGNQTEIVLTTNYRGHLQPRSCWRPLERFLAHQLHRHILDGMRASLPGLAASAVPAIAESPMLKSIPP
jgi:hypothetical protein